MTGPVNRESSNSARKDRFEHGLDVLGLRKEVDRLHAIDDVARA